MRKMIPTAVLAGLALALASCGVAATGSAQPTAGPPSAAPAPTAPAPTAAPEPTGVPAPAPEPSPQASGGASVRPPDELVGAALERLAAYLKVEPATLSLQSANAQEWPSSALGCPAADGVYADVIVEGFQLIFTDLAQTTQYPVHTAETAAQLILCQGGTPVDLLAGQAGGAAGSGAAQLPPPGGALLGQARAALAKELGVAEDAITVVSAEPAEWRDSSLGCPQPGMNYLQVITPGYRFVLSAQGQQYEYHADQNERVVRCASGQ